MCMENEFDMGRVNVLAESCRVLEKERFIAFALCVIDAHTYLFLVVGADSGRSISRVSQRGE